MASVRQRKKQATLFARRAYDAAKDADKITRNTEKLINKAIREGKTVNDLKAIFIKEAKKAGNYAMTAARTEATRIENKARDDLMNELLDSGVFIVKVWTTQNDDKVRDTHANMEGEKQSADDRFSNGGRYPGDPDLPPEERCNCRCTLFPEILELSKLNDSDRHLLVDKIQKLNDDTSETLR